MWWNKKFGKDAICGITHLRLRQGKNKNGISKCVYLKCGHGFFRSALTKWVNHVFFTPTCPMCRQEFNPLEYKIEK